MSINHQSDQTHFSFYSDEAVAGRQADRIAGSIERIQDALLYLSDYGLEHESAPGQLQRIDLALQCLQADRVAIEEANALHP